MDRRKFLKIAGASIAAGAVATQGQAIELKESKKSSIRPKHEDSIGYARYIEDYDISTDSMVYRLDIIDSTNKQHYIRTTDRNGLEEAQNKLRNMSIGSFKPMPYVKGLNLCTFIKL